MSKKKKKCQKNTITVIFKKKINIENFEFSFEDFLKSITPKTRTKSMKLKEANETKPI